MHRVRERLVSQRTGIINQIRAFLLERGVAVRQGLHFLRTEMPLILATRSDVLSPRMMRLIEELAGDWRRLDERIEGMSNQIEAVAHQDPACERLMTVPGIGPIISSAMVAAIGNGAVFTKGRDFGAWLGLVPKQISTGDRTILGAISRHGNRYLRALFVQAAWVVLIRIKDWDRYWSQGLDRCRQEKIAPQCAGDRARQQAGTHRLGRSPQGAPIRMHEDACDGVPTCLSVAPCSGPSRPSPAGGRKQRPALTVPARDAPNNRSSGRRNSLMARTKELHRSKR